MQLTFQARNVDKICATLPAVAADRCSDMEDKAQYIANKYGRAFLLYSKCHNQFNSSGHIPEEELACLRKLPLKYML